MDEEGEACKEVSGPGMSGKGRICSWTDLGIGMNANHRMRTG